MRQQFSIAKRLFPACAALLLLAALPARGADDLQLSPGAPERYTVQRGDTLWGISGKFLNEPWRWPEIWRMNRDQIKNPHWIYPGDVVVLDRSGGQPRLRLERGGQVVAAAPAPPRTSAAPRTGAAPAGAAGQTPAQGLPTVRLSPSVRVSPLDVAAIPSIPPGDIEPFLSRPLVTGPEGLSGDARIVAGRDEHVVRGQNDVIYASGIDGKTGDVWYIYRPARVFVSPRNKSEVLGYEQRFLGSATLERLAEVSTLRIGTAREEVALGDRLIPAPRGQLINYAPHPPPADIEGNIIATENASAEAGVGWMVTIDKGARDGLDVGTVLATYRAPPDASDVRRSVQGSEITRWLQKAPPPLPLPEERTGLVFVFVVFDRVSYAVVLRMTDPVTPGNFVRKP